MQSLVHFFENISPLARMLVLVGGLLMFWILEGVIPLFRWQYNKVRHIGLNLFFTLTTVIVNLIFAFLIVLASDWGVKHQAGVLYIVHMPLWLFTLVGLLLLDLVGAYLIHYIQHKVKWMWKFHLIHHSDTWVDATTANRHHPGESVFRAVFTLLGVMVTGAPMWLVMFYQSASALLSQFNHANISLPRWLDSIMSWIIVSPNMHKVHHHYAQPLTDTNYGNIFAIWDRIFGTYAKADAGTLKYGIDTYPQENENNRMGSLMQIPFREYRPPLGGKFSAREP